MTGTGGECSEFGGLIRKYAYLLTKGEGSAPTEIGRTGALLTTIATLAAMEVENRVNADGNSHRA